MIIQPDWPANPRVRALATTRLGVAGKPGASSGAYQSFNLGDHVGDDAECVAANRLALMESCEGLKSAVWLNQVHGTAVAEVTPDTPSAGIEADASISSDAGLACVSMTADCLPVLFCDREGRQVAAAHAGWRGLCDGVLVETVKAFAAAPDQLLAWMGPAISARHFEVGAEVREAFLARFVGPSKAEIASAFAISSRDNHYMADLYALARAQLQWLGVSWIGGGDRCTFAEADAFYSFRRDGVCGRQASLIYLTPD